MSDLREEIRSALRSPYLPTFIDRLAAVEGYLDVVWPRVGGSLETAGFLGSALYMADMALDAVEQVYEPVLTPDDLIAAGASQGDLTSPAEVIDVFHRSEEHTSELQSLIRITYPVFCLNKQNKDQQATT